MNLILTGLPGCGKSTIGRAAATKMDRPFIDTDRLIEALYASRNQQHCSCRKIFELEGDPYFRALETEAILSLNPEVSSIIAIGGGTLSMSQNVTHLKSIGQFIYLRGELQSLYHQAVKEGIPALLSKDDPWSSYMALAEQRIPLYEKTADFIIDLHRESNIFEQLHRIGAANG